MEKGEKVILVTGSTGFLGSAITRRLLASGYKIKLLVRKRDNDASLVSFGRDSLIKELILGNMLDECLPEQRSVVGGKLDTGESLYELFLSNVEIYESDITHNDLGLGKEEYRKLCYEVDEVSSLCGGDSFRNAGG